MTKKPEPDFNLQDALIRVAPPEPPRRDSRTKWTKEEQKRWTDLKRQYSDDLSKEFSKALELGLQSHFPNAYSGGGTGTRAASAHGIKSVDVAFNIEGLFLGLGMSVKVVGLPEEGHGYTHNFKRLTEEWTTETILYHRYMPAAIIVGMLFMPNDSIADRPKNSSLSYAVSKFRGFQGRDNANQHEELLEKIYVGIFDPSRESQGWVRFVDVAKDLGPSEQPQEQDLLRLEDIKGRLVELFKKRNPKIRVLGMP